MTIPIASRQPIELRGCSPEPLMSYLKALGIFRLVAEQKDTGVRACWRAETFVLHTSLDRDALARFFLEEYRPTPIVAPWNGGSGFYPSDNQEAINAILSSSAERVKLYQRVIAKAQEIKNDIGITKAPSGTGSSAREQKQLLLQKLRAELSDEALLWLDAAYVLTSDGPRYPPLLATGGIDGRLEFSNNYMQNVVSTLKIEEGVSSKRSRRRGHGLNPQDWVAASLFNDTSAALIEERSAGQFNPGGVGGPNATAGFEAKSLTNPWDYVLMIEGALFFAGAVARRLSAESQGKAVFPFTVDTSAAGYGTAVDSEYTNDSSRAELWTPLWDRPATYQEITHLFGEGRAQLARRQVTTGTDFARAIVGLGVERGIAGFQRYGFLKRNGLAFIAAPLGRFRVQSNPKANVLFDLDPWLDRLRVAARGPNAPEGLSRALREIDRAILEFCAHGGSRYLQEVLIVVGRAESQITMARGLRSRPRPLSGLSPLWLEECDDGSLEFRLAVALASIQGVRRQGQEIIGSIRNNLEPVTDKGYWDWDDTSTSVVWHGGDVVQGMAAILERRCLEARMKSLDNLSLESNVSTLPEDIGASIRRERRKSWLDGKISASLVDIQAFLDDRVDDRRIADLVLPLAAIRWHEVNDTFEHPPVPGRLTPAYAATKLLFLPHPFKRSRNAEDVEIRLEASILPLLRSDRVKEAYELTKRRLWASGLKVLADDAGILPRIAPRLAAALLFPIRYGDMFGLNRIALVQPGNLTEVTEES
ncbi:MAG: type I-U CRISPR-associated protein Csx17 [Chloroflexi bacterium]|nr:type I-U CRISPR-associated protein Csx17 [Chloroflexota bacterium]